jgi:1-deoxy-D-xylulose-5-phosphate synthase
MSDSIISRIDSPLDLRSLTDDQLATLCAEIRELIIKTTSVTGGHLASSLGAVEIAVAIHRALDAPRDRIIWDVGHQAYAHKIITGRRDRFETLRHEGGLSGFPRRSESEYDVVDSGHAGSSLSYGIGLVRARDLRGEDYAIALVIGDGSMSSGVAFEAMNQAGHNLGSNLIVILNDNEMSISRNVGGIAAYLSRLRIKPGYTHLKTELEEIVSTMPGVGEGLLKMATHLKESITHALVPGMLFEAFGVKYVGPIDGHDVTQVEETVREAREIEGPVLIHAITQKGKGYDHSERLPEKFHGVAAFELSTGVSRRKGGESSYTEILSEAMLKMGSERTDVVAVTAAMKLGTGLDAFSRRYPRRFFDVGIAEQFAVNLSAGLALGGLKPVVAIYSTFLQRAVDQLAVEICLQELPVVIVVDRAGLVGEDGSTHHGYFDLTYLRMLPNMTVMAPGCAADLEKMLRFALDLGRPAAIRFPRGRAAQPDGVGASEISLGRGELVSEGDDVVLLGLGDMVEVAVDTASLLAERGISASVVNARFAKPIDADFVQGVAAGKKLAVTLENNVLSGGFGSGVMQAMAAAPADIPLILKGLPDAFIQHGTIPELLSGVGLTAKAVAEEISRNLQEL